VKARMGEVKECSKISCLIEVSLYDHFNKKYPQIIKRLHFYKCYNNMFYIFSTLKNKQFWLKNSECNEVKRG
jgi:hypothetical protein